MSIATKHARQRKLTKKPVTRTVLAKKKAGKSKKVALKKSQPEKSGLQYSYSVSLGSPIHFRCLQTAPSPTGSSGVGGAKTVTITREGILVANDDPSLVTVLVGRAGICHVGRLNCVKPDWYRIPKVPAERGRLSIDKILTERGIGAKTKKTRVRVKPKKGDV